MTGYPAEFYNASYGPLVFLVCQPRTFRGETKKNLGCRGATIKPQPGFCRFPRREIGPRDASCCTHSPCFMHL